jgi:hypothetical protein
MISRDYEARAYEYFGEMTGMENTVASLNTSIKYFDKARKIYNLLGLKDGEEVMKNNIAITRARLADCDRDKGNSKLCLVEICRNNYEHQIKSFGVSSELAIRLGLDYVKELKKVDRSIEAERLAMKLAIDSRRVHGPEHNCTLSADEVLEDCKTRFVLMPDGKLFQAMRYENDGEICVVKGPIIKPRQVNNERLFHIPCYLALPCQGCPVIAHGLVSASHINGQVGDVRDLNCTGEVRFVVHFEKKNAKPSLVKPGNLRIAFELPIEE